MSTPPPPTTEPVNPCKIIEGAPPPPTYPDCINEPATPGPSAPPVARGEPIYLGTTPAGECVSGSTQWTFEPCGEALAATTTVVAVATVGVDPAAQMLPVTGNDYNDNILGAGAGVLLLGVLFVALSTRRGNRT